MAAQQDVQPRGEFEEIERLGHVVVAASAQATHPLVHCRESAQDQHRSLDAGCPQRRQHAEAVEPTRQHAVEHDCIVRFGGGLQQALTPGRGSIRREAVVAQRGGDFVCCLCVVLYDENSSHRIHPVFMGRHRHCVHCKVGCKSRFARR